MFLDPDKLDQHTPAEILDALARGHLGPDHRAFKAIFAHKGEAIKAAVAFGNRDRSEDRFDIAAELVAVFRHFKAPEGIPFFIRYIKEDPEDVPEDVVFALVEQHGRALEPLLKLYEDLEEDASEEVAFILASLGVRDQRILDLLLDRIEFDLSDSALLLSIYGDPAAKPQLEAAADALGPEEARLKQEIQKVSSELGATPQHVSDQEPFDIWSVYPERDQLPVDVLDEDERLELLSYPSAEVRASAANSFFNQPLDQNVRQTLLKTAQTDSDSNVRARAWESLIDATEDTATVEAMLKTLRDPATPVEERAGLVIGLAPEADRNEVRKAITDLYEIPAGRAKALEAMWRSVHPSFRDYFAGHLKDDDVEVKRSALWGVGYYGIKTELAKVRDFFDNEDLRSDALFAYALAIPADISRGRMKSLLSKIEEDDHGSAKWKKACQAASTNAYRWRVENRSSVRKNISYWILQ